MANFTSLDVINLKSHIEYHNKEYVKLFSDTLKPKHHFLCHYARILEHSGPFIFLWTFGFESKHRELKSYAKNITSRRNITLSLAIKFCISFSEKILNFEINSFVLGSMKYSIEKSPFNTEINNCLSNTNLTKCQCYANFSRYGTTYKIGFIIFNYVPTFEAFKIEEIFSLDGKILIFCKKLNVISYEKTFVSYLVDEKSLHFETFLATSIKSPPIHPVLINSSYYLRPKSLF